MRCDSTTLLRHRLGTPLNCAHWVRHGLTLGRVLVTQGRINIHLGRPPNTDGQMLAVFDALRNHYKLAMLYCSKLELVGAHLQGVTFNDEIGIPQTIAFNLADWNKIPAFRTQSALHHHLLDSFMPEALCDDKRLSSTTMKKIKMIDLKPIELSGYYNIRSCTPPRTDMEQVFHALLGL